MPDETPRTVTTDPDVGSSTPSFWSLAKTSVVAFRWSSVETPLYSCLLLVAPLHSSKGLHSSGKSCANAVSFS